MLDDVENHKLPGSSTKKDSRPSSSLLDILIKTEEPNDEPDPLDQIGNIGEAVICQFSGTTTMEFGQDLMNNALKMFEEAMDYNNFKKPVKDTKKRKESPPEIPPKRETALPPPPLQTSHTAKMLHQSDLKAGFYFRTKFDSACPEMFENGQKSSAQFARLHQKLEKERAQQYDEQISRDVDRLLNEATKIHGPKLWSSEEKLEFSSYIRNLRSGSLNDEDKRNIYDFYARAYPNSIPKIPEIPQNLLEASVKNELIEVKEELSDTVDPPSPLLENLEAVQQFAFDPAMKYEKEKEFRVAANNIFLRVFSRSGGKRTLEELATGVGNRRNFELKDIMSLIVKLNELMGEKQKKWSPEEVQCLWKYYDTFREKMHFTIVQTKDLGHFLRKAFGRLEQYEIERENDTALQEKRKYWQEYKKTHAPRKDARRASAKMVGPRMTPVRPYVKSNIDTKGETLEAKKIRKAAYLRQWRVAQKEKRDIQVMFGTLQPVMKTELPPQNE